MSQAPVALVAKERTRVGKEASSALRKEGRVPATVYGNTGQDSPTPAVSVSVEAKALIQSLKTPLGRNVTLSLTVERESGGVEQCLAFPYRIERDPITLKVLHVDFLRVDEKHPVEVTLELKLTGTAPGVKLGGVLVQKRRNITIHSLPQNIPAFIPVDLSELGVNQSIRIKELKSDQYEIVTPGDLIVVEVVSKGKTEEESRG